MPTRQPLTIPEEGRRRDNSLLSPVDYDADAVSIRSDQDSDSEDDELQLRARNSRELRAHDRMVFLEEDETDRLVTDARRQRERERRGSGLPIPPIGIPNPLKYLARRASDAGSSNHSRSPNRMAQDNTSATAVESSAAASAASAEDLALEKRRKRRARRQQKKERLLAEARDGEDGELMYEMEEGGMKDGSSTGESSEREDSEEVDRRGLKHLADAKSKRRRSCCRWLLIHTLIATAFAILVLAAWKLSIEKRAERAVFVNPLQLASNGTALFAPTTIVISLDGFRADFLLRGLTPRLNAFIKEGVSPLYMLPSFPSVTFPNHYTLATGLYPESHGVVGNTFWDPELQAEFYYTDPDRSLDPKWWGGEPFWETAERAGVRSAVHMWPGSEAHVAAFGPSYMDRFNGKEALPRKVDRVLEFLDKPAEERPQLVAAYVPNVDTDGHRYGPNSTEIRDTIRAADDMLDSLFQGLEARNLTRIVNVVVVSDHGMATTDVSRLLQLDDLVDLSKIEHVDGWPLVGLRPKNPDELQEIYESVMDKTRDNPNVEVYLRDVNMPPRYHFSRSPRIAPLWIVPKTGWNLVKRAEFDIAEAKANDLVYHPRGLHGYDHEHPLMRAIFVARGPAFPHEPNSRLEVFQNIEIYNILCDSIGLQPKPNNGTLRLPLKPVGLHNPETVIEEPADPVPSYTLTSTADAAAATAASSSSPTSASVAPTIGVDPVKPETAQTPSPSAQVITVDPVEAQPSSTPPPPASSISAEQPPPPGDVSDTPEGSGSDGSEDDNKTALEKVGAAWQDLWDWLTDKVDHLWGKISGDGSGESEGTEAEGEGVDSPA